jgi:3',5'-cyclic AMP phosphodiesterase CpdA
MPYRLAHFSDFHLIDTNVDFDRSLDLIDDAIERHADHLVISGDLVESGQMDVVAAFISALSRKGWGDESRLTLIPGNHDIFPFSKRMILPPIRRPTAIFQHFVTLTSSLRSGARTKELLKDEPYPFGKVLNKAVVLVGMDTTRNGKFNPCCWAEGELSKSHMKAAKVFLTSHTKAKHRIVAMHHHPWDENFYGGNLIEQNFTTPPPEEVEAWLRGCGATLVLCGHVHQASSIEIRRFGKKCQVLRSGTAGGVDDEDQNGNKLRVYHLIDLKSDGKIHFIKREFHDSKF